MLVLAICMFPLFRRSAWEPISQGGPGDRLRWTGFSIDLVLIGYVICIRATFRSIGIFGVLLVAALLGAIGWVLYDYGYLDVEDPGLMQWLVLLGMGLILGIGLCWSHVRRAISGQADMDDVDD